MQFKWVDFYSEFATKLLNFKADRQILIGKIRNVYSAIGLKMPKLDSSDELIDIDPFTVFGLFNKGISETNRIAILTGISSEFGIEADVPDDFSGIPVLNNMKATFYAFVGDERGNDDDIDNLWDTYEAALRLAETDASETRGEFIEAFDRIREQYGIRWNITMALFWIRPYTFINLDSRNRNYLSTANNISDDVAAEVKELKTVPSGEEYLSLIDKCKVAIDSGAYEYSSFPEISDKAYFADDGKAWLLTYNKDKWFWDGFAEKCEGTKNGKPCVESWACSSKKPREGDDVFLIKLGSQPRGIIGHGVVIKESYEKDHFDPLQAKEGKKEKAIDVEFDRLIDYEKDSFITQEELTEEFPEQHWSPQNSGIEINREIVDDLFSLWEDVTESDLWPSLSEYDPGITAEEYHDYFIDESIVKCTWLDALYEMYQMPGHLGTCKQMGDQYGYPPSHYVRYLSLAAERIAKYTDCPLLPREEENSRYWPVLFQGRYPSDNSQGSYCWIMREPVIEAIETLIDEGRFEDTEEHKGMAQFNHNTILYGPPGTGKTYNSVNYAVAICEERPLEDVMKEPYADVMDRYNKLRDAGRIAFTTFHQSYGYEEFIEGIKPILDDESGTLGYTLEDGIFKDFCKQAKPIRAQLQKNIKIKDHPRKWVMLLGGPEMTPLKEECFSKGEVRIGWDDYGDVEWEKDSNLTWRTKQMLYAFTYEMEPGDIVFIEKNSHSIDAIGVVSGDYEYDPDLKEYTRKRKVDWIATGIDENMAQYLPDGRKQLARFTIYAADYIDNDVLTEILDKYLYDDQIPAEEQNVIPYVFIIDEINRGNISKIFGELITLIEDTKRAGAPEAMEAVLPYSGESFSVPSNVYILGTMNTADRSIALMDTALRRRFDFIEMMPDPKVLNGLGAGIIEANGETLNVAKMLDVINERIEFLFDREHTIGHAFFTKLSDDPSIGTLAKVFEKNVIPLLKEYFYEDYEKIQLVLGDNAKDDEYKFILDRPLKVREVFNGNPDVDLPERGYTIQHEAFYKLESYKQIGEDL